MKRSNWYKHIDFILLDLLSLIISFLLAYYIRHNTYESFISYNYLQLTLVVILAALLIYANSNPFSGVIQRNKLQEINITAILTIENLALVVLYLFLTKQSSNFSRAIIFTTYVLYFVISYALRISYKKYIKNKNNNGEYKNAKSLLVICKDNEIKDVINNIENNENLFYHISCLCTVDKKSTTTEVDNINIISTSDLLKYISTNWIDEILITTDIEKIPKNIIEGIKEARIPIHICLQEIDILSDRKKAISKIGIYDVISTKTNNITDSQRLIKRTVDIIGALIGCFITLILIIIIGPIIYIKSPGNIFYVSKRVGMNGKVFDFYKFRSMVLNADDLKKDLAEKNRLKDGMMFKVDNDPRIIPGIGEFIRKTSLDEFPQFFNVLKGDMSLVGTRPPTIDEWDRYSPYYRSRLSIKPGITGMWQISGRSNITDFDEVVRLDNEYIDNFSLLLDIKILLLTIKTIFFGKDSGAM